MNPTINFGDVSIDLYKYAIQRNVSLGIPSAGKTFANKYVAEVMMDNNIPIVYIDPVGKGRYLKTPANTQNGKGYDVIVIGKDADIDLSVDTIADVIRLALVNRSSVVIDLFHPEYLEIWDEVVAIVCKTLLFENGLHGLRHLIIEESSEFVHQQGKKTEATVWIERLNRMSGNSMLGLTFIAQSSEQISKAVVKLCTGLMVGKQTELNSLKAIEKRFVSSGVDKEISKNIVASLPHLQAGEFYFWSEGDNPVKTKIPLIRSFHPSRNEITEKDVLPSEDIDSVIFLMKNLQPVTESVSIPFAQVVEFSVQTFTESPRMSVSIDTSKLSSIDSWTLSQARKVKYGSGTVSESIDMTISRGYNQFSRLSKTFGYLSNGNRTYNLNTCLECDYAELATRNLVNIF